MKATRRSRSQTASVLTMQRVVDDFLAEDTVAIDALARLVASKLEQQGATKIFENIEWLESEIRKRFLSEDAVAWQHPFIAEFADDDKNYDISITPEDLTNLSEGAEAVVTVAVEEAMESFFNLTLEEVRKSAGEAVARQTEELKEFRDRLGVRWAKPLRLFATELGLSVQLGSDMADWLRSRASNPDSALIEALLRLHARACQIAGEVEALLQAGFADGALSRWRTLHEVTVVALFLQERGNDVAQRYLDHLAIDSCDMARKYMAASEMLGYVEITDKEIAELEEDATALKAKYGKEFGSEYGWAAAALINPNPKFSHIEKAVNFEKLRPYYKLASNTVHAGPSGVFWKLGLLSGQTDMLLAGPSNSGLAEAGRLTAMSLAQVSVALMMVHTVIDSVIWVRIILKLSTEVQEEFLNVERKLADEEGLLRPQRIRSKAPKRYRVKHSARLRNRLGL